MWLLCGGCLTSAMPPGGVQTFTLTYFWLESSSTRSGRAPPCVHASHHASPLEDYPVLPMHISLFSYGYGGKLVAAPFHGSD